MKKLVILFISMSFIVLSSCEGDQGPPGPQGLNGGIITSSAFEIEVDFNAGNNYQFTEPYGFQVYPTDVTLVYVLWETVNGQDVWRLLPQTVEFTDGTLVYNFDFTRNDVRFFLDGTTNFATLDNSYTQNQVFRVVVVPADNVDGLDLTNLNDVMRYNNIEAFEKK